MYSTNPITVTRIKLTSSVEKLSFFSEVKMYYIIYTPMGKGSRKASFVRSRLSLSQRVQFHSEQFYQK